MQLVTDEDRAAWAAYMRAYRRRRREIGHPLGRDEARHAVCTAVISRLQARIEELEGVLAEQRYGPR